MKAPKSNLAKRILADETAARDLLKTIRKKQDSFNFEGRKITVKRTRVKKENKETQASS